MEEERKVSSSNGAAGAIFIGVLAGLAVGAIIVFLILRSRQQNVSTAGAGVPQAHYPEYYPSPQAHYPVQPPVLQETPVPVTVPQTMASYKNNEKWKIIRDKNGDICSIEVIRDANINS